MYSIVLHAQVGPQGRHALDVAGLVVGPRDHLYYTIPYLYLPILYYTMLYHTILYYTILYYTILYCTILYHAGTILYYTILYYTILYYTIPYYTILYCTILYYTILYYNHVPERQSEALGLARERYEKAAEHSAPGCFIYVHQLPSTIFV